MCLIRTLLIDTVKSLGTVVAIINLHFWRGVIRTFLAFARGNDSGHHDSPINLIVPHFQGQVNPSPLPLPLPLPPSATESLPERRDVRQAGEL